MRISGLHPVLPSESAAFPCKYKSQHPENVCGFYKKQVNTSKREMADIACMFTCRIMGVVKCTFYIYIDGVAQAFATTPVCKQAEDSQKNETIQDVLIAVTVEKVPNRLQPIISLKSMYY